MDTEPRNKTRETILTVTLVTVLGGTIGFFLNLVSLGMFAWVLIAVLAFTALGFVHYVVWGYAMSQQTAGEREEMLLREEREQEEIDRVLRHGVKDLSRGRD
jgi:hypothetical protein